MQTLLTAIDEEQAAIRAAPDRQPDHRLARTARLDLQAYEALRKLAEPDGFVDGDYSAGMLELKRFRAAGERRFLPGAIGALEQELRARSTLCGPRSSRATPARRRGASNGTAGSLRSVRARRGASSRRWRRRPTRAAPNTFAARVELMHGCVELGGLAAAGDFDGLASASSTSTSATASSCAPSSSASTPRRSPRLP